ncbi:MAG: signal peptidase I, partial [Tistlia sp.]
MNEEKSGGSFGETVRTVVYAVLIALVLRTFAYEPFSIPSGSMLPTLKIGDYLFVSKFSYGYSHHSLPWGWPPFKGRVLSSDQPVERGDVAVFVLPSDGTTDYIKRIVGLPGDTVQVREGRLYLNGELVERALLEPNLRTSASG